MASSQVITGRFDISSNLVAKQQQQLYPIKIKFVLSRIRDQLFKKGLTKLEKQRKLCLVLDLDHTLLHSKHVRSLSPEDAEKYLSDSCSQQQDQGDIIRWKSKSGEEFLTKLRPYVRKFLEDASKLFEFYVYTMGSHNYAINIAKILDPNGIYFGSRIISREKCIKKSQKSLHAVHVHPSGVIIVDDTKSVWSEHLLNLILIDKYDYFAHKNGIERSSSEDGGNESVDDGELCRVWTRLKKVHDLYFNSNISSDVRELLPIKIKLIIKKHPRSTDVESPLSSLSRKKPRC